MTQTRSQTTLLNAKRQVIQLTTELQKAQALNIKLLKEQDECSEDYKSLLTQNSLLKAALAEAENNLLESISEKNTLKDFLDQKSEDISEYEEALKIIRMHENNEILFEQLQKTLEDKANQNFKILNDELDLLRSQIVTLQSENIELKNSDHSVKRTTNKGTNNFSIKTTQN